MAMHATQLTIMPAGSTSWPRAMRQNGEGWPLAKPTSALMFEKSRYTYTPTMNRQHASMSPGPRNASPRNPTTSSRSATFSAVPNGT